MTLNNYFNNVYLCQTGRLQLVLTSAVTTRLGEEAEAERDWRVSSTRIAPLLPPWIGVKIVRHVDDCM